MSAYGMAGGASQDVADASGLSAISIFNVKMTCLSQHRLSERRVNPFSTRMIIWLLLVNRMEFLPVIHDDVKPSN